MHNVHTTQQAIQASPMRVMGNRPTAGQQGVLLELKLQAAPGDCVVSSLSPACRSAPAVLFVTIPSVRHPCACQMPYNLPAQRPP